MAFKKETYAARSSTPLLTSKHCAASCRPSTWCLEQHVLINNSFNTIMKDNFFFHTFPQISLLKSKNQRIFVAYMKTVPIRHTKNVLKEQKTQIQFYEG